ncbi:MAG: hypothetical protein ACOH12_09430 [Parvibaculaceae bacterium]
MIVLGRLLFLLCGFAFLFAPSISYAAVVDCSSAKTDFSKIICADPKLSALNDDVEKLYEVVLTGMPKDGKSDFEKSQNEWRQQTVRLCASSNGKNVGAVASYCEKNFESRIFNLKQPIYFSLGGIKFRSIDHYEAIPTVSANRNAGTINRSYIQIVNPIDASQRSFNAYFAEQYRSSLRWYFADPARLESMDAAYSQGIDAVGSGMITVGESEWIYEHEALGSSGMGSGADLTWNVSAMRPLTFFDVFKKDVDAERRLQTMIYTRVYDVYSGDVSESAEGQKWIKAHVDKVLSRGGQSTARWSVLAEGLVLTYDRGEIDSEKGGYRPCYFLSWKELDGLVDMESIKRLTAGPIAYAPNSVLQSECHPDYKPKE